VAHDAGAAVNHGVSARDFDEPNAFINGTGVVTETLLATDSVSAVKIVDGTITNAKIGASADIAQSKIEDLTSDLASKLNVASPTATDQLIIVETGGAAVLRLNRNESGGSAVATGEVLGSMGYGGFDGSGPVLAADMRTTTRGTISTGVVQGDLEFRTCNSSGSMQPIALAGFDGCFYGNARAYDVERSNFKTTATSGAGTLRIATGTASSVGAVSMESYANATTARVHISFSNGNGVVGTISTNASATAYNTSSDYRLKDNVQPITGALARLDELKPIRFEWKSDLGTVLDGFLAHEAQAVVPESVTGEKDEVDENGNPEYQGIDQSKLVPLLVAAVQELSAEVAALKAAQS